MSLERAKIHLMKYDLADRIMLSDQSTATVELAAQAFGVEPGMIAKTLSFLVKEDGGIKPVLVIAEGMARIDNRKYKDTFHCKASMIPHDDVEKLIGHAVGGVCPFGAKPGVGIYLDESLKKWDTVYPAAGTDNSAIRLSIPELEKASEAIGWVDVCK